MRRSSSWLLVPALVLTTACNQEGNRHRKVADDFGKFGSGGFDAVIGVETK